MTDRLELQLDFSGGDSMKNNTDNIDGTVGDEIDEVDDICEECCCFDIEACDMLHSRGCKVDTTCCW